MLPPDPNTGAPLVDQGVASSVFDATQFLYTGANPLQTGVAGATIDATRVAVLRGRVLTRDDQPLPGVTVTILNHPEFGQTLTRANGEFDLAVNGGGQLTVSYSLTGFLPAQRQIDAPWQNYAILPNVVLIPLDAQVSAVDLAANMPMQVARGSMVSDADGTRQATVLFPQGTGATMVFPNGSMQPITALSVRATEYTVGANGPKAMPAELPATSGYTYAVELSIDEAMAAGAPQVRFSTPVPFYVENFLGFPIGVDVPVGSYDRTRGVWIPENNGKVIKILSVSNGMADVDTNGDALADNAAMLAALAITDAERQQLATLYAAGQSVWRVLISHFTPFDCNWPFRPPDDAIFPPDDPEPDDPLDDPCEQGGNSVIECQNQTLGEAIGVVGTGFGLHYQSDRTRGYLAAYTLEIPLSGASLPASILGIELEIDVAGRRFERTFPAMANQRTTFTWDGKDAYGRTLDGTQPTTVKISYPYQAVYSLTSRFGSPGDGTLTIVPSRQQVKLNRIASLFIGTWHVPSAGLGGWSLSPHHAYVPNTKVLYRGDGRREGASATDAIWPIITRVAGTGTGIFSGDGGPATQAEVAPQGMAIGADGSLYIASPFPQRVRRVDPNGIITTVAGNGVQCSPATAPCGDGGPATQAQLNNPFAVAIGADNSLFIVDNSSSRIRKVDPGGMITTIAGTGVFGFSGDGGPARLARIGDSRSIAVGPDSALYIADTARVRRVGPDGIITTVAGDGTFSCFTPLNPCGDGGPALQAQFGLVSAVTVGPDGSIYIDATSSGRIWRVTPDGIIHKIAGGGASNAEGIPATAAQLSSAGVAVGGDGTVFVLDVVRARLLWFRPGGPINTLAGTVGGSPNGDGGPARRAIIDTGGRGLAVGPDGSVYFGEFADVRRIASISDPFIGGELVVPAIDGSEIFVFTRNGQHLRTLDALTGAVVYQFTYDSLGQLATITDRHGNVTTVERDGTGMPTGIRGPFGQRTLLDLDADGLLSKVTNTANEAIQLGYTPDGLLNSFKKPGGQMSTYGYDGIGRLIRATDPISKTKTLVRTGTNKDHTITVTSALGRTGTYRAARLSNGDIRLTTTDSAGIQSTGLIGQDGRHSATHANGTTLSVDLGPDPRWGMRAPIPATITVRTPSGLTLTGTTQRTVTLTSPSALLSLNTLTDTLTIIGRTVTSAYVGATRTLTRTWPTGRQRNVMFDTRARIVQMQLGNLAPTSFAYDAQGRLATVTRGTAGNSRTSVFAYGPDGFLESMTDPLGRIDRAGRDAAGRVTQLTLPGSEVIGVTYDANGNVVTVTPPGQPSHTFAYTARDEVASYTVPAVGTENRQTIATYNDDRQLTRVDRPSGQANTFQYDNAGRASLIDFATGQQTYAYDTAGRVLSLGTTQAIDLAYAYDGVLGTSATLSGAVPGSVTRTYDTNFRVTALQVNGINPIAIQYNSDDVPIQVGNLVLTRNGQTGLITGTTLGAISDTTTYDGFGMPATYAASHNGSGVYSATYSLDAADRITSKSETIGGTTHVLGYTYDLTGRLTEVRQDGALTATYAYDDNGNRLSVTGTGGPITGSYDAQDRLVQYGTATYAYSPNGDLVRKTDGGQITTYDYDGTSSLIGVTLPAGTRVDYLLDGRSRRVGRKVNGTLVQGFLYQDSLRPIAEIDGAGAVVSRFAYMDGRNVPAFMTKGGVTYRIITDQLGSPRLVIDVATGQIAQRLDYDEFGTVLTDTNPGFQPFGFVGGLYDPDTKLVRFGARNYDAAAGRWISRDPIRFRGGDTNLYGYVLGDPVNNTDMVGLGVDSVSRTCPHQPLVCRELAKQGLLAGEATQVQTVAQVGREFVREVAATVPNGARVTTAGTTFANGFAGVITNSTVLGGVAVVVGGFESSAEAANLAPPGSTPPGSTCSTGDLIAGEAASPSNGNPMWDLVNLFFINYREGTLNPGQSDNLRQRIGQAYGFDPLDWVQ